MAKKKDAKKKKKKTLRQRARRDVRVANKPLLNELKRAENRAEREFGHSDTRLQSIYDALDQQLQGINYNQAAGGIQENLQQQLGSLAGLLGGASPAGEQAAAQGVFGNIGGSALGQLSSDAQRNVSFGASTQRESGIERATQRRNLLEDFNDIIKEISEQRINVRGDMQGQILARLDELRDRRAQKRLAKQELELRKKMSNRDFRFGKKQVNRQNRRENRAQQTAEDFLTKKQLQNRMGNVRGELQGLREKIGGIKARNPGLVKQGGKWMKPIQVPDVGGGDPKQGLEPARRLNKLVRKRKRLKKRKGSLRKRIRS